MIQKRRSPHRAGNGAQAGGLRAWQVYGKPQRAEQSPRLSCDWRNRLPDAESYYRVYVAKLGKVNGAGWAQGACPFHDDRNASLSVNLRDECVDYFVGKHLARAGKVLAYGGHDFFFIVGLCCPVAFDDQHWSVGC